MKVSIITVSYQSVHTIEETIQSVIQQTYPDIEYLVIDGGSNDGTVSILKKYEKHITHWVSEPDKGMYDAMNKGLSIASGAIIGFLHSDDLLASQYVIEKIVNTISNENSDACYADLVYVHSKNDRAAIRYWKSGDYRDNLFLYGWMPPHPTFYVKKQLFDKYGGFRLDMGSSADYELMLRLIHLNKVLIAYLPETIIKMRSGGISNSSLRSRFMANRYDLKAWHVNGLKPKFYTTLLKPLRKITQFNFAKYW